MADSGKKAILRSSTLSLHLLPLTFYPMRCFTLSLTLLLGLLTSLPLVGQDDLMDLLEDIEGERTDYAYATFKTVRLVNGQSIELPAPGVLQLIIAHRFGRVNGGFYELFGLDQANMRLGFEYGLSPHLTLGIGRVTRQKTYDGFVKYKLLRQSTGKRVMPITLAGLSSVSVNTLRNPSRFTIFAYRLTYVTQLLAARKFSDRLSLQLMPSFVHRNVVSTTAESNGVFLIGAGGRFKVSGSVTINAEYYYPLPGQLGSGIYHPLSIGVDIETGGHVFQLIFSNSEDMTDNLYLTETDGRWSMGDIHFGFNLMRVFTASKKAHLKTSP